MAYPGPPVVVVIVPLIDLAARRAADGLDQLVAAVVEELGDLRCRFAVVGLLQGVAAIYNIRVIYPPGQIRLRSSVQNIHRSPYSTRLARRSAAQSLLAGGTLSNRKTLQAL